VAGKNVVVGAPDQVIEFDEFELDLARFELRRGGSPVQIERQVFDLLTYLVRAQGRVVTKEELLDNVWGTRFVTESALTTQIKFARRALGDDGTRQQFIRTVHRRGYEFVVRPGTSPGATEPRADLTSDRTVVSGRAARRLIGRDAAVADIVDLVSTHRLVTISGPGGVGKTQLALAVAEMIADHFDDGVVQIDLASLADPDAIAKAAAEAAGLGLREGAAVADALAETRAVVLIDNCEHVVSGVAEFVERLLARSHDPVRVLTTSREPLAVLGEQVYVLDPLPVAAPSGQASPAARLFVERAGHALGDGDLAAVEDLVGLLDGLPLAIELAAAQLGFMTLPELHRRLEQHRFSLERRRRQPSRHDSLADSVAWSWQLLDDTERATLTELSVFPGDFGLDAVERVASSTNPISVLRGLHAKSLVASSRSRDTTRFRLLFGVRDFVQPHQAALADGERGLRRRLASAYADWFDEWTFEEQWTSMEFLDVVLTERVATREIVVNDDPDAVVAVAKVAASCAPLHRYGIGVAQGRATAQSVDLDLLPDDVAARLALAGSEACYAFGDVHAKDRLAALALERATAVGRDDLVSIAISQQCVGRMLADPERCAVMLDDAVMHARRAGSHRFQSIALGLRAFCRLVDGSLLDEAHATIDDAERLAAPSGWDRTSATTVRGIARFLDGDRAGAAADYATVAASMRLLGLQAAAALFRLLDVTCRADTAPTDEIRTVVGDFLREYRRATGHAGRADALLLFAHRAVRTGDVRRASTLLDALRGRRLAHQVSMLILDEVGTSAGAPPIDFGVPSAVSPQSVPLLAELLDHELATLT
jgi:predicted ATPase/DNA-binding winged helix-turn-helix (wHTH) protein